MSAQFKLESENDQEKEKVLLLICLQSFAIKPLPSSRNFSSLKTVFAEGKWQRRASRLVPSGFGGTMLRGNTG